MGESAGGEEGTEADESGGGGGGGGGGVLDLPNNVRIGWWVFTLVVLVTFLGFRFDDLKAGRAASADVVVFLVLMCVWLLPLANEINLFGVKLKRQVEELRHDLSGQITALRSEIKVSASVSSQTNIFQRPPSIAEIQQLQPRLDAEAGKVAPEIDAPIPLNVPRDVSELFSIRYNLEMELRRVFRERFPEREVPVAVYEVRRELRRVKVLNADVYQGFKDVYSTCNALVHGRAVEEKQLNFARLSGAQLIRILKAISPDPTEADPDE